MVRARWPLSLLLVLIAGSALARTPSVPDALAGWRDWVLHDAPWIRCTPMLGADGGAEEGRICAWPGVLEVEADAAGARFRQRWSLQDEALVPLPGDARLRPQQVEVDGRAVEVLLIGERPMLQLAAGEHAVSGSWRWQRRPEALAIPDESGLVRLRLEGREVDNVERRDGRLWLGRNESRTVGDSLSLRVYRLLQDDVPLRLNTQIQLEVAGRAREVELGRALPEGFAPIALSSALPVALGNDGVLRAQVRPGSWQIHLQARATTMAGSFSMREVAAPWPQEEVWSFQPQAELRVVQPEGERPVDPEQVGSPWQGLPSFALGAGESLSLHEASRGLAEQRPHRLHLRRDLWLDFEGAGLTARDRLSGELAQASRLDLAAPWSMQRAAQSGTDLLVTQGGETGSSGVELRELAVDLDVTARQEQAALDRATGWLQDFESVALSLHLPPGWRLLAAGHADHAPGAWIERWSLLDLFWLSVIGLLAYRLAGWPLAIGSAALLLLAYHEDGLPLLSFAAVLGFGLLVSVLPQGRVRTLGLWGQRLSLVLMLLWSLPFLHQQIRLTLHPQLEHWEIGSAGASYSGYYAESAPVPMAMPAPPPAAPAPQEEVVADAEQSLERMVVSGSRVAKQALPQNVMNKQALNQYPQDAIVQAGLGLPDWSWNRFEIGWSGPVSREQALDLWLAPPWLTAAWRLLQAALLLFVMVGLGRRAWPGAGSLRALAAAGLLLGASAAPAADYPDAELLDVLRQRLLQPAPCAPQCAALAKAELRVDRGGLQLGLVWHAAEATAVPLPATGSRWQPAELSVDGRPAEARWQDQRRWVALERGVHRIELRGPLTGIESLDLQFAPTPALVEVQAEAWEVAGIDDGRLLGDSLQLARAAEASASTDVAASGEFPAFVRVVRSLSLDLDWTLVTTVQRIAPQQAGFTLRVPLVAGEQLQDEDIEVVDGQAVLSFAAGQFERSWRSRLPIAESLSLQAAPLERLSERWEVQVGPYWSAQFSGVPELNVEAGDTVRRFQPLPGESLTLAIRRPEALRGDTVAIDRAQAVWSLGQRSRDLQLEFNARATRGGQHVIRLPAEAELISVSLRGEEQNLRLLEGALSLPLLPGENPVSLRLRIEGEPGWVQSSATLDLGAPSANLRTEVQPSGDRWVLGLRSEGVGPAVLYWPQLLAMAVLAWALARLRWTPLGWAQWTLLGLGFSTVSWWAALIVAGWLLALGLRRRFPPSAAQRWRHRLLQLGLAAATLVALLCLLAAIPYGLLGSPDMQIAGNGSSAQRLVAFLDRSSGGLPELAAFTAPMWLYKASILAWALWLANALLGWLRWGADCMATGGWWPARLAKPQPQPADAASAAAAPAEGTPAASSPWNDGTPTA